MLLQNIKYYTLIGQKVNGQHKLFNYGRQIADVFFPSQVIGQVRGPGKQSGLIISYQKITAFRKLIPYPAGERKYIAVV